jgi:hypothetical protein
MTAFAVAALAMAVSAAEPANLAFSEYFRTGTARLEPSAKLLALDGKRVRITGFMARMEEAPAGAFYLASRPVVCDEGGAGTGDLPPDAVLVVVPWAAGLEIPFLAGPLEVVGELRIGAPTLPDGMPARIRIVLDLPNVKSDAVTPKSEGGKFP